MPAEPRLALWRKLLTEWKLTNLEPIRRETSFRELPAAVEEMLAGKSFGRVVVRPLV